MTQKKEDLLNFLQKFLNISKEYSGNLDKSFGTKGLSLMIQKAIELAEEI